MKTPALVQMAWADRKECDDAAHKQAKQQQAQLVAQLRAELDAVHRTHELAVQLDDTLQAEIVQLQAFDDRAPAKATLGITTHQDVKQETQAAQWDKFHGSIAFSSQSLGTPAVVHDPSAHERAGGCWNQLFGARVAQDSDVSSHSPASTSGQDTVTEQPSVAAPRHTSSNKRTRRDSLTFELIEDDIITADPALHSLAPSKAHRPALCSLQVQRARFLLFPFCLLRHSGAFCE